MTDVPCDNGGQCYSPVACSAFGYCRNRNLARPLVALACSSAKSPEPDAIPAIHRYDGPLWRTLRTACRVDARTGEVEGLDVWFLSAKYGFHPATLEIGPYEQEMTKARAAELLRIPTSNRAAFALAVDRATSVLFAGGELYRETMRLALIRKHPDLSFTDGGGIGFHRQQLREWIEAQV